MELRPYQLKAVDMLRAQHASKPCLVMPTGAGKTVVACAIAEGALKRGHSVLVVVHLREVVLQTARRFREHLPDVGVEMGKHRSKSPVTVASIQTVAQRETRADVLIVDEAHHAVSNSYRELLGRCPTVIGLTATPQRLDGRGLGDVFGALVEPTSYEELFTSGVLLRPKVYAPPGYDRESVRRIAGEFSADLAADEGIRCIGDLVRHWKVHAEGRRTVAFACTVAHSKAVARVFSEAGFRAEHLDGKATEGAREATMARLRAGEIDVISNCALFGEGWDLPELGCAILARPTESLALYRQQCGRVMRSAPGKPQPVILDHVGNAQVHGYPWDKIPWSLDGEDEKPKAEAPVKTCPECFAVCPAGCKVCPACGEVFHVEQKTKKVDVDGTLVEFRNEIDRAAWYSDVVKRAYARGYKIGWARYQYRDKFKVFPRLFEVERKDFPCVHPEGFKPLERAPWIQRCPRCTRERRPKQDPPSDRVA